MKESEKIGYQYLGFQEYDRSVQLQNSLQGLLIREESRYRGFILFLYHEPVITLGRYSDHSHVLIDDTALKDLGISLQRSDRGGDVTCHEPGQIVIYPIIDLRKFRLKLKDYVSLLERVVMEFLKQLGIRSERIQGRPGVWVGGNKKIASLGISVKNHCTKHGAAINVNNDLKGFDLINPCGYEGVGAVSVKRLLNREVDLKECSYIILNIFSDALDVSVENVDINGIVNSGSKSIRGCLDGRINV